MRKQFSLFQSHLDVSHAYICEIINVGDIAVDATCGNGHDTLFLAEWCLSESSGAVYSIDIQSSAIEEAKRNTEQNIAEGIKKRIHYLQQCHSSFPTEICSGSVKVVMYNLGYLPGGNKSLTTQVDTTIKSIRAALDLVTPGGIICVTCYPGHQEGENEEKAILKFVSELDPKQWSCCHHRWCNRTKSPSLLLIQKAL
ncbi:MAG: class I SAM-dependent methyltransferase [Chlamydiota bacterium]|nr:class I SAM-dependent methyltransferase [Chlamydiota bacterium]